VPDAKLEKWIIDRRLKILADEGIEFRCGVDAGRDVSVEQLRKDHDAIVIAIGSRVPRALGVPGSDLQGVHPAMDYLYQRNRWVAREEGRPSRDPAPGEEISAAGKRVVVVGGGDTGMDCVSNALREGAADVLMLDVYPELPPSGRLAGTPWPLPPKRTLSTYALEEGGERRWASQVTEVVGRDGKVVGIRARQVEGTSSRDLRPVEGSEYGQEADLVLVAIGFNHPEHEGLIEGLDVPVDDRGNVRAPVYGTALEGVFACGDARIGQSLVVTAIAEGRRCAKIVDRFLGGTGVALPVRAYEDEDPDSLRHQGEVAGNVTVGDAFWEGPRSR
jgi:glutamate synthase (NADPH/NADH) small chain